MNHTYDIQGMTCQSCESKVKDSLLAIDGVSAVEVDLQNKTASIVMQQHIGTSAFQNALPSKYTLSEKSVNTPTAGFEDMEERSKWQQLKPLFLILFYIAVASILLHKDDWNFSEMMIDFMGLFFIVFSFFKMLDLKGFVMSFSMYDPIASIIFPYAKVYPFLETILGLMLLLRFNVNIALIATVIVLGFTTYGVTKTLLSKRTIKCACLGTALDLPMTEATFIENSIMIVMSVLMLSMN